MRPAGRARDSLLAAFSWLVVALVLAAVGGLVAYVVVRGGRALSPELFFGDAAAAEVLLGRARVFGGIWPAIAGTLSLVALASMIAMPVGIAAGIHLAEYASPRWRSSFGLVVDMLSGVPSIVMGLFGFALILLLRRTLLPDAKTSLLLAASCIALLVLPYLIRATQTALESLPQEVRLIGPSLGLSKSQNLLHVMLPSASRGILSGVILAIGRAAEDTAVIMLTGAVATAGGGAPRSILAKFEALPFEIFVIASEHRTAAELDQGFGAALVLLTLTGTLFLLAAWLRRTMENRWSR